MEQDQIDRLAKFLGATGTATSTGRAGTRASATRRWRATCARWDSTRIRRACASSWTCGSASRTCRATWASTRAHGAVPREVGRGGAAREREHAGPRGRAVGQGRLRRHGDREDRPARPGHDGGAAGRVLDDQRAAARRRRADRHVGHPAGDRRSTTCCSAPTRWRVPGGVAGADGHAAAPQAGELLRPCGGSGAHPARADHGPDGAPVSRPAAGRAEVAYPHPSLEPS